MLRDIANGWKVGTLANRFRQKRLDLLRTLLVARPDGSPLNVLDVGGTDEFWRALNLSDLPEIHVTFVNLFEFSPSIPHAISVRGDARFLEAFPDHHFDVVFSNSVIEHVGNLRDQRQMAKECLRVGKKHFIQTPNRYFPIEPHFLIPLFQFLPCSVRAYLHRLRDWGWWKRSSNYLSAYEEVESIRLLSERQMRYLFPMSRIWKERFFIFTKCFVALGESNLPALCNRPAGTTS